MVATWGLSDWLFVHKTSHPNISFAFRTKIREVMCKGHSLYTCISVTKLEKLNKTNKEHVHHNFKTLYEWRDSQMLARYNLWCHEQRERTLQPPFNLSKRNNTPIADEMESKHLKACLGLAFLTVLDQRGPPRMKIHRQFGSVLENYQIPNRLINQMSF